MSATSESIISGAIAVGSTVECGTEISRKVISRLHNNFVNKLNLNKYAKFRKLRDNYDVKTVRRWSEDVIENKNFWCIRKNSKRQ
ncbi:hypothetical protein M5J15_08260 [Serratia symbiotica]|uniref:hypothetical protein n=1 Tax=Serratia symbiotica TaxID=138074 RepID=UPI0020913E4A|nr:hypothetical protein [Serratia symbiotica]USS94836.1 hypothetical protein M5J15_08260 [Serratia symbiotica]